MRKRAEEQLSSMCCQLVLALTTNESSHLSKERVFHNVNKLDLRCAIVVTIGCAVVVSEMIFGSSVVVGLMIFTFVLNENPQVDEG